MPVLQGRGDRRDRTGTLVGLFLVAIALAALKPWAALGPATASPAAAAPSLIDVPAETATAAQPTPAPAVADRNAMTCLTHQVEQVLTLERWPDREIKSWSQADGGAVTISSSHVVGIGVCPGTGPAVAEPSGAGASRDPLAWSGASLVDVQRVDGDEQRDLGAPTRITEQADYIAAGVLYGPPMPNGTGRASREVSGSPEPPASREAGPSGPTAAPALPAWPPGRYAITYVFPGDPNAIKRTVIVEITTPLNDT